LGVSVALSIAQHSSLKHDYVVIRSSGDYDAMRAPQKSSKVRTHRPRYASLTPEQAAERNREAQARYRERHAERLAITRKISAVLKRRSWHQDDAAVLAADLHRLLGDECEALRRALGDVLKA
jgi:hypothetical protein